MRIADRTRTGPSSAGSGAGRRAGSAALEKIRGFERRPTVTESASRVTDANARSPNLKRVLWPRSTEVNGGRSQLPLDGCRWRPLDAKRSRDAYGRPLAITWPAWGRRSRNSEPEPNEKKKTTGKRSRRSTKERGRPKFQTRKKRVRTGPTKVTLKPTRTTTNMFHERPATATVVERPVNGNRFVSMATTSNRSQWRWPSQDGTEKLDRARNLDDWSAWPRGRT